MLFITVQDKTDGTLTATSEFISLEKMERWSNQEKRNYARYFKQKEFNRVTGFTNNKGDKESNREGKIHENSNNLLSLRAEETKGEAMVLQNPPRVATGGNGAMAGLPNGSWDS